MSPDHVNPAQTRRVITIFAAILLLYGLCQVLTLRATLLHHSTGFETENFYHPTAVNILQAGVYGFGTAPDIEPSTFRPPLYSAVLAGLYGVFGVDERVGIVFNNLLLLGLIVLTFMIGSRFGPWVGLIAAVLIMLDPVYLAQANRNQSDMLFAFLMTAFLMFGLRAITKPVSLLHVILCGGTLGLAMFTRAAALYLWIPLCLVLILALWDTRRPARAILAVLFIVAVQGSVQLSWSERNESITGNRTYAGMLGWHLVSFYAPLLIAKRDGSDAGDVKRSIMAQVTADPSYQALAQGEQERYLAEYGTRLAKDNLKYAPLVLLDNIPKMFLGYPSEPLAVHLDAGNYAAWNNMRTLRHDDSFAASSWDVGGRFDLIRYYLRNGLAPILVYGIFMKAVNAAILVLAAIALVRMTLRGSREARSTALLIVLVFGALAGTALLTTQARFRLPIMPALAVPAAITLLAFLDWISRRQDWFRQRRSTLPS